MPTIFSVSDTALQAGLLTLLVSAGCLALGCIWRAKTNLEKEQRAFKSCQKVIESLIPDDEEGEHFDAYEKVLKDADKTPLRSSQDVQQYLYAATNESERELNSGYASDRLYAILKSVSTDNLVRKAPSLSDLHELTMQRERGGLATATFRAISPAILVLGILGTLLGVHNKLDEVGSLNDISALADALIPGALAVFFTVLVMFCRGWVYNKELAKFVSEFDEFTLKKMLPFFQPESQEQVDSAKLNQILLQVKNSKAYMEKTLWGVKSFHDMAQQGESTCVEMLSKVQNNLHEICCIMGTAIESQQNSVAIDETTGKAIFDYLQVRQSLLSHIATLSKRLNEAEKQFALVYKKLGYPGMVFVGSLPSTKAGVTALEESAGQLGSYVGCCFSMPGIESLVERLNSFNQKLSVIGNVFNQYRDDANSINEADDVIDSAVARMAAMGESADELYTRLKQQYAAAVDSSEQFRESFCQLHHHTLIPAIFDNIRTLDKIDIDVSGAVYAKGWKGFVQIVKDRMMQLRSLYRHMWGKVALLLLFILLIVWHVVVR